MSDHSRMKFVPDPTLMLSVIEHYNNNEMGTIAAGMILGCSHITAGRLLKASGVTLRHRGRPRRDSLVQPVPTPYTFESTLEYQPSDNHYRPSIWNRIIRFFTPLFTW